MEICQNIGHIPHDVVVVKTLKIGPAACAGIHCRGDAHGYAEEIGIGTDIAVECVEVDVLINKARQNIVPFCVNDSIGRVALCALREKAVLDIEGTGDRLHVLKINGQTIFDNCIENHEQGPPPVVTLGWESPWKAQGRTMSAIPSHKGSVRMA